MKKFVSIIFMAICGIANSQNPSLEQAIKDGLTYMDSAKTISDMQAVVGRFERISFVETSRWEPFYYLAFVQINLSFWEKDGDKKDAILDLAEKNIERALTLNGDKSELFALQGFLYQGRIQVSATRGMTYSQKAAEILEKAVEENPENPRALFLLAQNIYYTPKMFGGGAKNALPKFQEAKVKFDNEKSQEGISPKWGAKSNLRMIETCSKDS